MDRPPPFNPFGETIMKKNESKINSSKTAMEQDAIVDAIVASDTESRKNVTGCHIEQVSDGDSGPHCSAFSCYYRALVHITNCLPDDEKEAALNELSLISEMRKQQQCPIMNLRMRERSREYLAGANRLLFDLYER